MRMGERMTRAAQYEPPPRYMGREQSGMSTLMKAGIVVAGGLGLGLLYVLSPGVNLANKMVDRADAALDVGVDAYSDAWVHTAEEKRKAVEYGWTIGQHALGAHEWKRIVDKNANPGWLSQWMGGDDKVDEGTAIVTRAHGIGMWLGAHGLANEALGSGRWAATYEAIGRLVGDGMDRGGVLRHTDVVYGYTEGGDLLACRGLNDGEWDSVVLRQALLWKVCVQASALKVSQIAGDGRGTGYDRMTTVQRGLLWLYTRIAVPGMATAIGDFLRAPDLADVAGYARESGVARVMIKTLSVYYGLGAASGIRGVRDVIELLVRRNGTTEAAGEVLVGLDATVDGYETVMGLGELFAGGLVPREWVYAMLVMLRHGYAGSIDDASDGISQIGPLLTNATAITRAIERARERAMVEPIPMPVIPAETEDGGEMSRGYTDNLNVRHAQAHDRGAVRVYDLEKDAKARALAAKVAELAAKDGGVLRVIDGAKVRALGWRTVTDANRELGFGSPVRYESFEELVGVAVEGRLGKKYQTTDPLNRGRCEQGVWPSEPLTWAELRLWIALNDVPMYVERVGRARYQIRGTMWDAHIFTVRARLWETGVAIPEIWLMFLTGEYVGLNDVQHVYALYTFMKKAFPEQAQALPADRDAVGYISDKLQGIAGAAGELARSTGVGVALIGAAPPMYTPAVRTTPTTPPLLELAGTTETRAVATAPSGPLGQAGTTETRAVENDTDTDDEGGAIEIDAEEQAGPRDGPKPSVPVLTSRVPPANETLGTRVLADEIDADPGPRDGLVPSVPVLTSRVPPANVTQPVTASMNETSVPPMGQTNTTRAGAPANETLGVSATTRKKPPITTSTNETVGRAPEVSGQRVVGNATTALAPSPGAVVPAPVGPTGRTTRVSVTANETVGRAPPPGTAVPVPEGETTGRAPEVNAPTGETPDEPVARATTYAPLEPDLEDRLDMYIYRFLDAFLPEFIIGRHVARMREYVSMVPEVCKYAVGEGMFATRMHRCEGVEMGNGVYRYVFKEGV